MFLVGLFICIITYILLCSQYVCDNTITFSKLTQQHPWIFLSMNMSIFVMQTYKTFLTPFEKIMNIWASFFLVLLAIFKTDSSELVHKIASYCYFGGVLILNFYYMNFMHTLCALFTILFFGVHLTQWNYRVFIEYILICLQIYLLV